MNSSQTVANGKVILLEYTIDYRNYILSFDKYYEKPFTVHKNGSYTMAFDDSQIIHPGMDSIICDIAFDPGTHFTQHSLYMNSGSFSNLNHPGVVFYENNSDTSNHFSIRIPGAGTHFKYFLAYSEFIQNGLSGMYSGKVAQVYPGYNSMTLDAAPVLVSPANNSTIDYNTEFSYTSSGPGIYMSSLYFGYSGSLFIISTSSIMNIPDLSYLGLDLSGTNIFWGVNEFYGFNSIEEFLSPVYPLNPNWRSNANRYGESFMFSSISKKGHKVK